MKHSVWSASVLLSLACLNAATLVREGVLAVGSWLYFDAAALVATFVVPLVLLRTNWTFKEMLQSFRQVNTEQSGHPINSNDGLLFRSFRRFLYTAAAIVALAGTIIMLYAGDRIKIGPNLAMGILAFLYALLLDLFICTPMECAAKVSELMDEE